MSTELAFDLPGAFWLLVPVVAACALVWRRGYLGGSRRRQALMTAVRIVTCALVVTALARPHMRWEDPHDAVIALVDVSESVTAEDLRAARAAVGELAATAAEDGSRGAGLILFGGRPVLLVAPEPGRAPGAEELALLDALVEIVAAEERAGRAGGAVETAVATGAADSDALLRARALRAAAAPEETCVEDALSLARGLLPASARNRILLVSDGHETRGNGAAAAGRAAARGIHVDSLALPPRTDPEVLVERLVAPGLVHVREPFDVAMHIVARAPTKATLLVARNGFVLPQGGAIELAAGRNVLKLSDQSLEEGFHVYQVRVIPESGADTRMENNVGRVAVAVSGRPRVLLVDDDAEGAVNLVQALREEEIVCEVRPAAGLPTDLDGLLAFDLVLLCDVEAAMLPQGSMQLLKGYVRDYGGGLGMLGGQHSFGLGGYARTPVEDVLPVDMTIKKSIDDPNLALVNVIDVSGSMEGQKIELAKEAAIAAAEVVQDFDRIGVVAFDSLPYEILPLTPASERATIIDRVARLAAGGGTDIEPALDMAYQMLRRDRDARIKHVILLSDGQSPGRPDQLAQRMKFDGITVSTVAVGTGADQRLLADIARRGGGRAHFTNDFSSVPQIFTQEALTASKSLLVEEPTLPELRQEDRMLDGIDLESMPILLGYVATTPKPDATVILVSDRSDPLLAIGRAGSGWGVAFTSDAEHHWGSEWIEDWADFPKFWAQLVRRVMRAGRDGHLSAEGDVRREEAELVVELDLSDRDGRFLSQLDVEARVTSDSAPAASPEALPLELVAPGRYRATTEVPGYGVAHRIELVARSGDEVVLRRPLTFVESYSPEHRVVAPDEVNLRAATAAGNGGTVASAAGSFTFDSDHGHRRRDLAGYLLAAAACLLLGEVALRRL